MDPKDRQPRRIGIDARLYGPLGKGLGRYAQEVVDNILRLDTQNHYVVFLCAENFDSLAVTSDRVKKVLVRSRWYSLSEQFVMPFLIWREKLDLVHFPHFNVPVFCPAKFVVTIHDLILTKFPTPRATTLSPILYKLKNLGYKAVITAAVRRAEKIIAVSEFTKNDIAGYFKTDPDKVAVTYEGVAEQIAENDGNETDDKKTLLGYNISNSYILYVGNAYPHKNLENFVWIFSKIKEKIPGLRLVLVGKEDYFYARVKKSAAELGLWKENDLSSAVLFAGYVPDNDLRIIYRSARAYVFPSLYEGFGLPPLEAMSNGCPVASSDKASMPEILGDAAVYFNPEDGAETERVVIRAVRDEALRQELRRKGFERIKRYSWIECAKKTLDIYRQI